MISQTESVLHILTAALISTGVLLESFRQQRPRPSGDTIEPSPTPRRRAQVRWPWLLAGCLGTGMTLMVAFIEATSYTSTGASLAVFAMILLAAAIGGAGLVRLGLRGRRVGDHPYCRRCEFDLFGKPPGSEICNECGASLAAPLAIIVGAKQRRVVPLAAGLFVLLVAMAFSVSTATRLFQYASAVGWWHYKPTSWLLSDMTKVSTARQASWELNLRLAAGDLTDREASDYLAAAKVMQWSPPFIPSNFALTLESWESGKLSETTMRNILQADLDMTWEIAAQAAQGRTLRYIITPGGGAYQRTPSANGLRLELTGRRMTINGLDVPADAIDVSPFGLGPLLANIPALGDRVRLSALPADLPLGPATLEMHFTATSTLATTGKPTLTETREVTLKGVTTIVTEAAMRCPPLKLLVDAGLPVDHPANVAAGPESFEAPDPLPAVYAMRSDKPGGWILKLEGPTRGAMLGELVLRDAGVDTSLGPIFLQQYMIVERAVPFAPSSAAEVHVRPMPELGYELFSPVGTYQLPIVIRLFGY